MTSLVKKFLMEANAILRELEEIPSYKCEDNILFYTFSVLWKNRNIDIKTILYAPRFVVDTWLKYSDEFMLYSSLLSLTNKVLLIIILDPRALRSEKRVKTFIKIIKLIKKHDAPILIQAKFSDFRKILNIIPSKYWNYIDYIIEKRSLVYAPTFPFAYEQASRNKVETLDSRNIVKFVSDTKYWTSVIETSIKGFDYEDRHYKLLKKFYKQVEPYRGNIMKQIDKIQKRIGLLIPAKSTFNALPRHLYRAYATLQFNFHKYGETEISEFLSKDYNYMISKILNVYELSSVLDIALKLISIRLWEYTSITFDRYEVLSTYNKPVLSLSNVLDIKVNKIRQLEKYLPPVYQFINKRTHELMHKDTNNRHKLLIPSARLLNSISNFENILNNKYISYYLADIANILCTIAKKGVTLELFKELNESNARLAEEIYRYVHKISLAEEQSKVVYTCLKRVISGIVNMILPFPMPSEFVEALNIYFNRKSDQTEVTIELYPIDAYTDKIKGNRFYDPQSAHVSG